VAAPASTAYDALVVTGVCGTSMVSTVRTSVCQAAPVTTQRSFQLLHVSGCDDHFG